MIEPWILELVGDRQPYLADLTQTDPAMYAQLDARRPAAWETANVVSSADVDGIHHWPILDVDRPYGPADEAIIRAVFRAPPDAEIVRIPSTTEGHCHVYVQHRVTEAVMMDALLELAVVGIIETGYAIVSIRRRATFLRLPHILKRKPPVADTTPVRVDSLQSTDERF